MSAVFSVDGLIKRFGGLHAVDGISFALQTAEITALIGPNGAGKTTCFNLLSGNLTVGAGRIDFNGTEITRLAPHRRQWLGLGRTFQIAAVFRSMTVAENVATALMAAERPSGGAVRLLQDVGLGDVTDQPVTALAYGDVKRVELAMTLAAEPTLLLLDEPTAGMAGAERRAIMETVTSLARKRGMTLLFTEHDMDAVFSFAERILVMNQGRLIADGSPEAIRADIDVQRVYLGIQGGDDA